MRKQLVRPVAKSIQALIVAGLLQLSPVSAQTGTYSASGQKIAARLMTLQTDAPTTTTEVRFYIDDILVSELTNEYAVATKTKPVWQTVVDPAWLPAGNHQLRIDAVSPAGIKTLSKKPVTIAAAASPSYRTPLSGAWQYTDLTEKATGSTEETAKDFFAGGMTGLEWTTVLVPHSLGTLNKKWNRFEGSIGAYRRTINIPAIKNNEQLAIILESCYWSGQVFVNGQDAGHIHGGYLPGRFDISKLVKAGNNEIVIITDNRFTTMGLFRRINEFYWNWGGILQEVYLEKRAVVSFAGFRASGAQSGALTIYPHSINNSGNAQEKNISITVKDAQQKTILTKSVSVSVPAGEAWPDPVELKIDNPILWQPGKGYLYTVEIKSGNESWEERTGFRDVKVAGPDIIVNGKVVQDLQGFNRHADYPGLGRTQPAALAYRELKQLYDKGFRLFRPAHYPTTPAQLDAADELGLLVIEEVNVTGLKASVLSSPEVKAFGAQQLTRMINRDRSHPSIIAWSVGNENLTEVDSARDYIRETIALGRSKDPSRLYTHVTMRYTRDLTYEFQDFVAQNYYAGWYTGEPEAIVKLLDSIQPYSGNKPLMLSEYGAEAIQERPGIVQGTEYYQSWVVDAHNRLLNNRPHFFGKMYWCSTEFWCRPDWKGGKHADPVPPFHTKSLVSISRAYKKIGWRVIFSPIRLHTDNKNYSAKTGEIVQLSAGKPTTITKQITIEAVKGKAAKGTIVVEAPKGFTVKQNKLPFTVNADGSTTVSITLQGMLPAGTHEAHLFVRGVIDADTEAHPLLYVLKDN